MKFFKYFFTFKIQALDPDPYLDLDPHPLSKPRILIRKKWMRIRNPGQGNGNNIPRLQRAVLTTFLLFARRC